MPLALVLVLLSQAPDPEPEDRYDLATRVLLGSCFAVAPITFGAAGSLMVSDLATNHFAIGDRATLFSVAYGLASGLAVMGIMDRPSNKWLTGVLGPMFGAAVATFPIVAIDEPRVRAAVGSIAAVLLPYLTTLLVEWLTWGTGQGT